MMMIGDVIMIKIIHHFSVDLIVFACRSHFSFSVLLWNLDHVHHTPLAKITKYRIFPAGTHFTPKYSHP